MKRKSYTEILSEYFAHPPLTPKEARTRLHNMNGGLDLPAEVYGALQTLLIQDMGGKDSVKKKLRQKGKRLRKKRTGQRK